MWICKYQIALTIFSFLFKIINSIRMNWKKIYFSRIMKWTKKTYTYSIHMIRITQTFDIVYWLSQSLSSDHKVFVFYFRLILRLVFFFLELNSKWMFTVWYSAKIRTAISFKVSFSLLVRIIFNKNFHSN